MWHGALMVRGRLACSLALGLVACAPSSGAERCDGAEGASMQRARSTVGHANLVLENTESVTRKCWASSAKRLHSFNSQVG